MTVVSPTRHHAEWIGLLDVSGPFLSLPTLLRVFPQGLDAHDPELAADLRALYHQWLAEHADRAIHHAWIREVLHRALAMAPADLAEGQRLPIQLQAPGEAGEIVVPDLALVAPNGTYPLFILIFAPDQHLERPLAGRLWTASPAERARQLLRHTDTRLGLVTNGEQWMLIHAPPADIVTYATFTADLWFEEPLTLRAFHSLLGLRRLVGVANDETLAALLAASKDDQYSLTDQLGVQVRHAVEVLLQTLDRIDRDNRHTLLAAYTPAQVYVAAVTVMMRLVFLFSAEERGMLLLDDDLYQRHYAVSTLYDQLQAQADRHAEELLGLRHDAWARLLATFRAVYGGMGHDRLRLPAYGSTLFDPDRYPFLEGRGPGSSWRDADPLPVDNRTVLHLLRALQRLEVALPGGPAESRRLSYRGLTVEQIGQVYEGLLDHTAVRAAAPVLGLRGGKGREPEAALDLLEIMEGAELLTWLKDLTGRSPDALTRALALTPDTAELAALTSACEHEPVLTARVRPFFGLLRRDTRDQPVVYPEGSLYMTQGTDRRVTGTHYTPTRLTELVVEHALTPLAFHGPAEGLPRAQWRLRPAAELLQLRVCDPAMGSGAFLVQACRYLAERLVESWAAAETATGQRLVTPEGTCATGDPREDLFPRDLEERRVIARRIIADRCLFGVDKNPLAVEMAKLALWLDTLRKDRAFNYLDHALRPGDSLLGVVDPRQLEHLHIHPPPKDTPEGNLLNYAYGRMASVAFAAAIDLRRQLESFQVVDIHHARLKEDLARRARTALNEVRILADLIVGTALRTASRVKRRETVFPQLAIAIGEVLKHTDLEARAQGFQELADSAALRLRDPHGAPREPFHWTLEFPEVLDPDRPAPASGFDAIIGNPPFQGGQRITGALGTDYRDHLVQDLAAGRRGSADLCAYFLLRAGSLLREPGQLGAVATNTIAQGDTREVGLDALAVDLHITRAISSMPWPGAANLEVSLVWLRRGPWAGEHVLNDIVVGVIAPSLNVSGETLGKPHRLKANEDKSFQGSNVLGMGFVMTPEEAQALIARNPKNRDVLFPYINGEDLNTTVDQSATRWVINFKDWPLDQTNAEEEYEDYEGPVAADYPDCLQIILEKVKPERDLLGTGNATARDRSRRWWQFARPTLALYRAAAVAPLIFACARVTKYLHFVRLNGAVLVSEQVVVALGDFAIYVLLESSIHESWTLAHVSTLETRLRYTPSDCFENYPFPAEDSLEALKSIGKRYEAHRRSVMQAAQLGLTKTYNRFHNPEEQAEDIVELRRLHIELDRAVVLAYGWDDLVDHLEHGFHETRQGVRFTISDAARRKILDNLLALNHERYDAEVQDGLHEKPEGPWYEHADKTRRRKGKSKRRKPATAASATTPPETEASVATRKPGLKRAKKAAPLGRPLQPHEDIANQADMWGAGSTTLPASSPGTPIHEDASPARDRPIAPPPPTPPVPPAGTALSASDRIIAALRAATASMTKNELLEAAGLADALWPAALAALKRLGILTSEGRGPGTRYRLIDGS